MFLMKDIVQDTDHNPVLRTRAEKVTFPLSDENRQLAHDLMEYLINSQDEEIAEKYGLRAGVGLAAPQVNHGVQMTAVLIPDEDDDHAIQEVLINPVILSESVQEIALAEGEGCLSVDRDVPGYVPRHKKIKIRYQDLDGNQHELRLRDYPAIVVQHELDHLIGVLFYDHINADNPYDQPDDLQLLS
ncbi:peptide deformylase [Limosilactobacillus equigenerosi]|uniref:Peptide deformylase n=1 Tax=Limosilactobacillus equigenerosi DSM 18793 = JCM 14505 TaxID=1423742 RepID=A0A0R1US04_9LACO|nr:peptide deformylase [Limosilactobacillus equigenerosi]KRL95984.1 Peptide deformylase (PDF) [Limosilactobacillus equigenerosi DSM 18793 = JCM 14505]